ncbi:hypothetical protein [Cytobacillus sp. IB215316]|uniref:hypothetical protein n=1 Tax=Cytobacillus sp. IB215316 TaxID=3097354 RepID=UPI002A0F76D3|nr:hypothetical protein [Cytobacillus sp. IB215316]MDX8360767.1 hypothetical protein [Cytobacillus sp. IB215316]
MERELFKALDIAVMLVIVSVILSTYAVLTSIGNTYASVNTTNIASIQAETYGSEILAAEQYGKPLSATSLFVILDKNMDALEEITLNGTIIDFEDREKFEIAFKNIFHTKVTVNVTESADKFKVDIREE